MEQQEGIERRNGRPRIPQELNPQGNNKGCRSNISSIGNDDAVSNFDIADDAGLDDIADQPTDGVDAVAPSLDVEPVPDERDMKESVNNKAFVVVVESVANGIGKKYGPSEAALKQWLSENSNKIRSIKEPIKRTGKNNENH